MAARTLRRLDHHQNRRQLIDLGPAEPIDAAILSARRACRSAESKPADALKALSDLVLKPIESKIAAFPRWLVSPDAELWLAPWAALPLSNGAYCLEKHELNFLVSARDLVNTDYQAIATRQPALFANPDFDLAGPLQQAQPLAQADRLTHATNLGITRSAGLKDERFKALPGTLTEANAIQKPITHYAKANPTVWLGRDASELNYMKLQSPKS